MTQSRRYKKLDDLFSKYIRQRAMLRVGGCEKCFRPKDTYTQLHTAHFWPRRMISVRFDSDNAAGLCPGCHRYLDDNAAAKVEWFKSHLGQRDYDMLEVRASRVKEPLDVNGVFLWLQNEIRKIGQQP